MPKVTKKDLQRPLVEAAPVAMDREETGNLGEPLKPKFAPLSSFEQNGKKIEFRRVRRADHYEPILVQVSGSTGLCFALYLMSHLKNGSRKETISVPQHRLTPLRSSWLALYKPVTENLQLDMRMNLKTKKVEVKTKPETPDSGSLQKAADFVEAFILGFDPADAIALLRLDDLYVECFEIKDVKTLRGEHLSRCIGRLAGKTGKTKFTIENATKTRIVLADTRIHILGSYQNIRICRDAICGLILGSPPGKVYSKLRSVCTRLNDS